MRSFPVDIINYKIKIKIKTHLHFLGAPANIPIVVLDHHIKMDVVLLRVLAHHPVHDELVESGRLGLG